MKPLILLLLLFVASIAALLFFARQRIYLRFVKPRNEFADTLKKRVQPEVLREWAFGLLQASRSNDVYGAVSGRIHPAFVGLYDPAPSVYTFPATRDDAEHVKVTYSAGHFGCWGVEIGAKNRPMPTASGSWHQVPWAPGVYFFYGGG